MTASRIDSWLGNAFPLTSWDDHNQAVDAALIISDATTSITVKRGATTLSAQTVRIEDMSGRGRTWTSAGVVYEIDALIIGYKGHPSLPDCDLKPGDRFAVEGALYEIVALIPGNPTSVQAYARTVR